MDSNQPMLATEKNGTLPNEVPKYMHHVTDPVIKEIINTLSNSVEHETIIKLIDNVLSPEKLLPEVVTNMFKNGDEMTLSLQSFLSIPFIENLKISEETMVEALKNSNVNYDEGSQTIKIGLNVERKTVILYNTPEGITTEEIEQFFEEFSGNIVEIKSDIGNSWFISFKSENDAVNAIMGCRRKKLGDEKANLRLKSENILKGVGQVSNTHIAPTFEPVHYYPMYNGYTYRGGHYSANRHQNRNNFSSRTRGKPGKRHGSRHEPKEPSIQIMASGEVFYPKKHYKNKSSVYSKSKPTKRNDKRNPHPVTLGTVHFPPLPGSKVGATEEVVDLKTIGKEQVNIESKKEDSDVKVDVDEVTKGEESVDTNREENFESKASPESVSKDEKKVSKNWVDVAKATGTN